MTRPFAPGARPAAARRDDAGPRPLPAESQALLRECFAVFEARLLDGARSSLEMSNDLFESNKQVAEKEVQEFLSKRGEWIAQFPKTLAQLFERRLAGTLRKGRRPDSDISLATLRVLTAFDQEKQTALAAATAFLDGFTRRERSALDLRMDELFGVEPPLPTDNPFSIAYIVDALGATSRAIYPNPRVWRPLLERLLSDLRGGINKIYLSLNLLLADRGVLPDIKATLRARSDRRPRDDRDLFGTFANMLGQGGLGINVAVPDVVPETGVSAPLVFAEFATPGQHSASGDAAQTPGAAAMPTDAAVGAGDGTPSVMDAKTILTGLTALAEAVTKLEAMPSGAALSDSDDSAGLPNLDPLMALGTSTPLFATLGHWQKLDLASAIADAADVRTEGGVEGVVVPLNLIPHIRAAIAGHITNPADGITMDVIALLFDYVFGDKSISESAREIFARLQVPIVKAALLDRTFFSDRRHPARLFLDHLADAAIGTTNHEDYRTAFVAMAQGVIDDLCANFDIDVSIFAKADARLLEFVELDRTRSIATVSDDVAAVRATEEREADRAQIIAIVRDRLLGLTIPFEVRSFVETVWVDYLTALREAHGEESEPQSAALQTLGDLLWSIEVKERTGQKARLTKLVPPLIGALRKGCAAQNVAPERVKAFLDTIFDLHMAAIKPKDEAEGIPAAVPAAPVMNVHDYVSEMVVGTWLTFIAGDEYTDARLTYVSPLRTKYVFTGRFFSDAKVLTAAEVAYQLGSGKARVLVEPVPLWDRAVSSALDKLAAGKAPYDTRQTDPTPLPA